MRLSHPSSVLLLNLFVLVVPAHAGEMRTDEIPSKHLGRPMKLNVLLPDDYEKDAGRRYPVVYLLHGNGGDYGEWRRVGIEEEAKGLPLIIAMPEGNQSFYVNHHEKPGERWEDYIVGEVVQHVDASYRTLAARESRAISGLSMGGYGAMVLGLRHPELFASIASHSGALGVPAGVSSGPIARRIEEIFGPQGSPARKAYDLPALARDLPAGKRPHLYIDCGSQDFLLESNRNFVRELARLGIDYEYREVPGKHDFAYWKRNVRHSLSLQLEALARAAAAAPSSAPAAAGGSGHRELAGSWRLLVDFDGNVFDYILQFREEEGKLAAMLHSPRSGEHRFQAASFEQGLLKMEIERQIQGTTVKFVYEGKLSEKGLAGTIVPEGFEDQIQGKWQAERKKPEDL
jgi:putative tributyrin esterase